MPITRLTQHELHQVSQHLTRPGSHHWAALRCVTCDKHIQWLSQWESKQLEELGVEPH
jgi:hypothetical protein